MAACSSATSSRSCTRKGYTHRVAITAPPPAAPALPPLACPHCQGTDLRCIGRVERSGKVSLFARVILSRAAPAYADSS